jgi:hypothetical protein
MRRLARLDDVGNDKRACDVSGAAPSVTSQWGWSWVVALDGPPEEASAMTASEQLHALLNGFRVSQALHVAAVLGLSDLLADGALDVDTLARATDADPGSLRRLLRALAAVGVYVETDEGSYANTELSAVLQTGSPESVKGWATFIGESYVWSSWGSLLSSTRSGETAFDALHGMDVWAYRAADAAKAAVFDAAMTDLATRMAAALTAAYDFPPQGLVVDIGGGHGALLASVLAAYPNLSGVLFDLPHVVAGADQHLAQAEVRSRLRLVAGDMFQAVPPGADVYLLKSTLHDWADAECESILRVCRDAMSPSSTLLIVERLLAGPNEGADTKFSDLNMLVMTGGRERSEHEFIRLLERSGLEHRRTLGTTSPWSVLEAAVT